MSTAGGGPIVRLRIRTLNSTNHTVEVSQSSTVSDLKQQVQRATGIVIARQRLIFQGKVLKNDKSIESYALQDGNTLHLVVRPEAATNNESAQSSRENAARGGSSSNTRWPPSQDTFGSEAFFVPQGVLMGAAISIPGLDGLNGLISNVMNAVQQQVQGQEAPQFQTTHVVMGFPARGPGPWQGEMQERQQQSSSSSTATHRNRRASDTAPQRNHAAAPTAPPTVRRSYRTSRSAQPAGPNFEASAGTAGEGQGRGDPLSGTILVVEATTAGDGGPGEPFMGALGGSMNALFNQAREARPTRTPATSGSERRSQTSRQEAAQRVMQFRQHLLSISSSLLRLSTDLRFPNASSPANVAPTVEAALQQLTPLQEQISSVSSLLREIPTLFGPSPPSAQQNARPPSHTARANNQPARVNPTSREGQQTTRQSEGGERVRSLEEIAHSSLPRVWGTGLPERVENLLRTMGFPVPSVATSVPTSRAPSSSQSGGTRGASSSSQSSGVSTNTQTTLRDEGPGGTRIVIINSSLRRQMFRLLEGLVQRSGIDFMRNLLSGQWRGLDEPLRWLQREMVTGIESLPRLTGQNAPIWASVILEILRESLRSHSLPDQLRAALGEERARLLITDAFLPVTPAVRQFVEWLSALPEARERQGDWLPDDEMEKLARILHSCLSGVRSVILRQNFPHSAELLSAFIAHLYPAMACNGRSRELADFLLQDHGSIDRVVHQSAAKRRRTE